MSYYPVDANTAKEVSLVFLPARVAAVATALSGVWQETSGQPDLWLSAVSAVATSYSYKSKVAQPGDDSD
jgi:hypothetical protein